MAAKPEHEPINWLEHQPFVTPKPNGSNRLNHQNPSGLSRWRFWGELVLGLLMVSAVGYFFWPTLVYTGDRIYNDDNYSSGLIIPLVIAYVIYRKWPELAGRPWQPSWWGLAVMAAGLAAFLLSEAMTIPYLSTLSFLVVLGGILQLAGGWRLVQLLSFPLLLLALTNPLPHFLISRLTLGMQLLSTQLAGQLLQVLGYVVAVQGNIIDLGERRLQIIAACSGLSYLFNALGLGIIFCYFFQRRGWKVALLLLALVPFAIVANAVRLVCIAIWPIFEKGLWHASFGLSIFIVGFDYLKGINWLLNRFSPADAGRPAPTAAEPARAGAGPRVSALPYLAAGLVLVLVAGPLIGAATTVQAVPLRQSFDHFPLQLGGWEGRALAVDRETQEGTGADQVLQMDFLNPAHGLVSLWIAYYENQKSGGSVHSPVSCFTGSGWKTEQSEVVAFRPGRPVRAMLLSNGREQILVYYWYFQRGRWLVSEYSHKLSLGFDRLVSGRADGALVRLVTPVPGEVSQARQRLLEFLDYLYPVLPEFIQTESMTGHGPTR